MKKATRQHTKEHNRSLVLSMIYNQGPISRAEIARLTRLTPTTVSNITAKLIKQGLVTETNREQSTGGKPATLLSFVDDALSIISIDLSNNELHGAVTNLRGQIQHYSHLSFHEITGEEALSLVYQLIDGLISQTNKKILGIGIGTPGLIDVDKGIIRHSVNLNWKDLPLRQILVNRYDCPVNLANDCQAAALGEFLLGKEPDTQNLLLIKIGRGVGAGVVINKQVFFGDGFGAGEIGHIVVEENDVICRCGHTGCLETWVSDSAIIRLARSIAIANPDSISSNLVEHPNLIDLQTVITAYKNGDPDVRLLIQDTGRRLGKVVAYLIGILNIHRIVLAGDIAEFGDEILLSMYDEIFQCAFPILVDETHLEISSLGREIVILGAAAMLLQNELRLI